MRTSKAVKILTVFLIVINILIVLAIAGFAVKSRYCAVTYNAFPSKETADELNNPYQGFYTIHGFRLSDQSDPLSNIDNLISKEEDQQLVLVEINLNYYSNSNISSKGLRQLDDILSKWSQSGKQIILRFLYDWSGQNLETEPDNISRITTHMEQVAPIVNDYADYIYILQGIFVGNYGEMNNSAYLSDANIKQLMNHLAKLTDPSIFLSVRTPNHWKTITNYQLTAINFPAFDGSLTSRLGLYNDGMLGSDTDLGTYTAGRNGRSDALSMQNKICDYVPNGGEVVIDNPYNDFENAVQDFKMMHVSYLNGNYDNAVLDKWRNTTYYGDDCFNGTAGYTYIKEHLGYRYALRSSRITFNQWFDDNALFSCVIENVGFAPCLKSLTSTLILENTESAEIIEYPIGKDLRGLVNNGYIRLTSNLPVREYDSGLYRVYLKITDPITEVQIKLATDLEQSERGVLLGEFTLSNLR